jgi:ADP-L-glycero-D-manno-heptose 6-epimerase
VIVVTGAAGFIGSCIVARLNDVGREDLLLVDEFSGPSDIKNANLKNKKFLRYCDKDDFLKEVRENKIDASVDCVIHMGACSSTVLQDADYFEKNNFRYSRDLALWAGDHKARFIYASSAATYGDGSNGYSDDDGSIRRCRPLNLYGESKQKFDLWVLNEKLIDKVAGLKFFNVFGPNEYHKAEMRSVVAKAYPQAVKEGKMTLFKSYKKEYADGEQKRDFVYIKDAVDIVMYFFDNPGITGIYNAGTGHARSWNDLARALFAAIGKTPRIEYVDMPEILRPRYQYFTRADMTKLRQSGYTGPFMELEEAVKDYVGYLENQRYI